MADKQKTEIEQAKETYDRCIKKFEEFNVRLAKEEGYFIGVINRPTLDVFPVTDEMKAVLEKEPKKQPTGLGSL